MLAEDDENDVLLIRRAFARGGLANPLCVVRDGDEAICYLSGTGKYTNREEFPFPDLLLLDLKMPGADGLAVLQWVRQRYSSHHLRIVVLTASENLRDVSSAYRLGADSFLVKPFEFEDAVELARLVRSHWLPREAA